MYFTSYCVPFLRVFSKPPYDGPSPTSISEVADKTVSSLNIHKAIANDTSKRDGMLNF